MGRCRVFQMPDGSVVVTRANYEQKRFVRPGESAAEFYARVFATALAQQESPSGVPFIEVDDADVPWNTKAMGFRSAWRVNGQTTVVDMPIARSICMANIRRERDRRLAATDGLLLRAQEQGQDTTGLKAYRQVLRDIPQTTDPTKVDTPEALAALEPAWPVKP